MPCAETNPDAVDMIETKLPASLSERFFGLSTWKFFVALGVVVLLAFYVSKLLFGTASLEVLLQLETYEEDLKKEIVRLKQENAQLQKEYFELKELEATE